MHALLSLAILIKLVVGGGGGGGPDFEINNKPFYVILKYIYNLLFMIMFLDFDFC